MRTLITSLFYIIAINVHLSSDTPCCVIAVPGTSIANSVSNLFPTLLGANEDNARNRFGSETHLLILSIFDFNTGYQTKLKLLHHVGVSIRFAKYAGTSYTIHFQLLDDDLHCHLWYKSWWQPTFCGCIWGKMEIIDWCNAFHDRFLHFCLLIWVLTESTDRQKSRFF